MKLQRCPSAVDLTDAEMSKLRSLPDPVVYDWEETLRCELQAAHEGGHVSLGQTGADGVGWWLAWSAHGQLLQVLPPCPATTGKGVQQTICTLPLRHEGAHDFDIEVG